MQLSQLVKADKLKLNFFFKLYFHFLIYTVVILVVLNCVPVYGVFLTCKSVRTYIYADYV